MLGLRAVESNRASASARLAAEPFGDERAGDMGSGLIGPDADLGLQN